jgi:hypothetical protein
VTNYKIVVEGKLIITKRLYDCLEQKLEPVDSFNIKFKFDGDEISAKEEADRMIYGRLALAKANTAVKEHEHILIVNKEFGSIDKMFIVGGPSKIDIPENTSAYYQVQGKLYNLEKNK